MASGTAPETAELQQEGFDFTETGTQQSGTKKYLIKRGFERGLPVLGDPFDTTTARAECRLKRRKVSLYGPHADIWTMTYGTLDDDQEAALDQSLPAAQLLRNMDAGAEAHNVGETFQTFDATGNFLVQDAFVRHFTSNVQIRKVYRDFNKLLTTCRDYAGCINSVVIFDQPIGTVQLGPVTAEEFINKYGQKRWMAHFTFMLRCIPDGIVLAPPATWNYEFNPEIAKWEKAIAADVRIKRHFESADDLMPNTGNIKDASKSDNAIRLSTYNSMAEVTRRVLRESLDPAFFRVMDMGALMVVSLNSKSTEAKQQFYPTLQGGATVKVRAGWVSVATRGRWSIPETTVTLTGASGWVMVRKSKGDPTASGNIIAAPIAPDPVNDTFYEWSICSYTLNATSGKYSIDDYSLGEKEWYATL